MVAWLYGVGQCENIGVYFMVYSKCKRSLHSCNLILSPRLTQLWGVQRSLLLQLFAVISIMSCHL